MAVPEMRAFGWPQNFLLYKQLLTFPVKFLICKQKFWFQKRKHSQLSLKCSRVYRDELWKV